MSESSPDKKSSVRGALDNRKVVTFPVNEGEYPQKGTAASGDGEPPVEAEPPAAQTDDDWPDHEPDPRTLEYYEARGERSGTLPAGDYGLPVGCPVVPLGKDLDTFYFLDTTQQMQPLTAAKVGSQAGIAALFSGEIHFLWEWMPQYGKPSKEGGRAPVTNFKSNLVRDALMDACAKQGIFNPTRKLRGRGAWRAEDGGLVLNLGDILVTGGEYAKPGPVDDHIYPSGERLPRPHERAQCGPGQEPDTPPVGDELMEIIQTWRFARPSLDPTLCLGWLGAAVLSAALKWRPMVFIIGDKATGKSTFQEFVQELLGDMLIQTADTSAAGIYQRVGFDGLPVAVDEIEAEADPRKTTAVIKLARLASSGALMLRGGQDHKGVEFNARSCFLFSAINPPPLGPQDYSRMAIINFRRLTPGGTAPDLRPKRMKELGRRLIRRLVDRWEDFDLVLQDFQSAMTLAGHGGRACDQFGTLLACAHVLTHEGRPDRETLDQWAEILQPDSLAELENTESNWRRCLTALLTTRPDDLGKGAKPVGHYLELFRLGGEANEADAHKGLTDLGLKIMVPKLPKTKATQADKFASQHHWLAIPNSSSTLNGLFEGTEYAGLPGQAGVWQSALRQMPRGKVSEPIWRTGCVRISGVVCRCTLIRLDMLAKIEEIDGQADEGLEGQSNLEEGL